MTAWTKSLTVAAGMVLAGTVGASAALLDFTQGGLSASGTLDGIDYELSVTGGSLNLNTPDAPDSLPVPLALDTDGVGISDDEISDVQTLTLTFTDGPVLVTDLFYLDLFDPEEAVATFFSGGEVVGTLGAGTGGSVWGFAQEKTDGIEASSIVFSTAGAADDKTIDFALAGVGVEAIDGNIAPIPLPAGGLLLIGALGGMAVLRRRKGA